jgi:two-component system NarL family response regulator
VSAIRVLVVDDHPLFRRGVLDLLAEEPDIEVVGEAAGGAEAIQKAAELAPEVVLMDLTMPGQTGIETTAYLSQRWPQIRVVMLTVSEDPAALFEALSVGARGYVVKTSSPRDIVDAVRQAAQGWVIISPAMALKFLSRSPSPPRQPPPSEAPQDADAVAGLLTNREREILQLLAQGMPNAEIATALVISENTIKTHVKNILGKLQASSRREAVARAARLGLPLGNEAFRPGE